MYININTQIDIDDILSKLSHKEMIKFIEEFDQYLSSWDCTGNLLVKFTEIFQNDFVKGNPPEGKLNEEEKNIVNEFLKIIKREFEKK